MKTVRNIKGISLPKTCPKPTLKPYIFIKKKKKGRLLFYDFDLESCEYVIAYESDYDAGHKELSFIFYVKEFDSHELVTHAVPNKGVIKIPKRFKYDRKWIKIGKDHRIKIKVEHVDHQQHGIHDGSLSVHGDDAEDEG